MLKDVLYDAEDVVDEFECEALRRKVVESGNTTRKVRRFFSSSNPLAFRFRMGHKLKKIRERVAEIAALKSDFGLTERIFDRHVIHREREMTHSFVDASNVIGRDKDKENIIEMLLQSFDSKNVSIIPVVGIGEVFELEKVIIKILSSASPSQRYMDLDIDQLQRALRQALDGRKYLLILDDVWSEDPRKWLELKALLMRGVNGSKILVTTRSSRVASIMGTDSAYDLNDLPYQHCLSLFLEVHLKISVLESRGLAYSKFELLPRSIGNLKHLKYLSLWNNFFLKRLPNSICKLQSLQALVLGGCDELEELPRDMKNMVNLRLLWITTKQKYLPPRGLGCLKSLRFLFITGCENLQYLFEDLHGLTNLRRLFIGGCDSLISLPQSIKFLTTLKILNIANCENLDLAMEEVEDNQHQVHSVSKN
ncbi:hypothetical protein GH714_033223 [Hevea brasiliensis]|uniref:Uncharacterized protein n=1 Tax=Hevea brasiliensis TaxID=3981 RepID=A0A6A6M3M9_HEVBR|nr:hypothetical protein GH714_033223 [Hevea brasiliensis]